MGYVEDQPRQKKDNNYHSNCVTQQSAKNIELSTKVEVYGM